MLAISHEQWHCAPQDIVLAVASSGFGKAALSSILMPGVRGCKFGGSS